MLNRTSTAAAHRVQLPSATSESPSRSRRRTATSRSRSPTGSAAPSTAEPSATVTHWFTQARAAASPARLSATAMSSRPVEARQAARTPLIGRRIMRLELLRLAQRQVVLPALVLELDVLDGDGVG